MNKNAFPVAGIQAIVAIICATAAYFIDNPLAAKSALFGSFASLANGLMLAWHGLERSAKLEPGEHLKAMYRLTLERYVIVVLLLAAGMWLLVPLHVLAGFVAGQAGLVLARLLWNGFEKKNG